jgi:chromosome segregation ATPase
MDEALQQYMANVEATQRRDHADAELINQYNQLADRKTAAEARSRALEAELASLRASSPQTQAHDGKGKASTPKKAPIFETAIALNGAVTQLRQQLADAQKARALLETEVAKLPGLQSSNASQNRQLMTLEKEIISLKRRISDKDEEIREKQKLAERVQDDMISLTLEVNMAEERANRLVKENKELVDRWMKEMGSRADTKNQESGW